MKKYGQAEYAYGIMKQITEKLREGNVITEEQYKKLDEQNKDECYRQFCTSLAA